MTIVFTDVTRAASLWEYNPLAMRDATLLHNELLRKLLKAHMVCLNFHFHYIPLLLR